MYKVKHQMVPVYFENIIKRNDLKPFDIASEAQTLSFQDTML